MEVENWLSSLLHHKFADDTQMYVDVPKTVH